MTELAESFTILTVQPYFYHLGLDLSQKIRSQSIYMICFIVFLSFVFNFLIIPIDCITFCKAPWKSLMRVAWNYGWRVIFFITSFMTIERIQSNEQTTNSIFINHNRFAFELTDNFDNLFVLVIILPYVFSIFYDEGTWEKRTFKLDQFRILINIT